MERWEPAPSNSQPVEQRLTPSSDNVRTRPSACARRRSRDAHDHHEHVRVSRDASQDGRLEWDRSLIVPDFPSRIEMPGQVEIDLPNEREATVDLLELLDRVDLLIPQAEDLTGATGRSALHRPLLYRKLLDEVLARMHSARRGYRGVSRTGAVIRGRVDTVSLIRHQATGDPRLRCHYDELTESTLLLGVICAALEWVAEGRGVRSPFEGRFSNENLRNDAVSLRRTLAEVNALPPSQALLVGSRLRLNRLDQPWSSALTLALHVLREQEYRPTSYGNTAAEAVELSVATNTLWERIVHHALARSGFHTVFTPTKQPAGPPKTLGSRHRLSRRIRGLTTLLGLRTR